MKTRAHLGDMHNDAEGVGRAGKCVLYLLLSSSTVKKEV